MAHAQEFIKMYNTLNNVHERMPQLNIRQAMIDVANKNTRDGPICASESSCSDGQGENPRKGIPSKVLNAVRVFNQQSPNLENWVPVDRAKKPHSWFVCFINNIVPNQDMIGWQSCQCSHRCTNGNCIVADHLCWESAADNQSRGNTFCTRKCIHQGCQASNVCTCQGFHIPPCV